MNEDKSTYYKFPKTLAFFLLGMVFGIVLSTGIILGIFLSPGYYLIMIICGLILFSFSLTI
jgi:hypothetical protein